MQNKVAFNREWLYKTCFTPEDALCTSDTAAFEAVELPHTNKMLPLNCFDEHSYQFVSCYKKIFRLPEEMKNKKVFLDFEGVMIACRVFCNGKQVGAHEGGYTPFSVDITDSVSADNDNVLVVEVDSTERPDIPPFGKVVDYLTYGGIYREVFLRAADATRIERLWLSCKNPCAEQKDLVCRCDVTAEQAAEGLVKIELLDAQQQCVATAEQAVTLAAGNNQLTVALNGLENVHLWSLQAPVLYTVRVTLQAGAVRDEATQRYGFRSAEFTTEGFFLNGEKVKLVGVNRHQSWPYVGYAMPERVQRHDAVILKKEMGCNVVRASHYPQSHHFLDACDELGLLVVEEIPGWQHIGDQAWKEHSMQDVRDMITRDYNHPSIILWGVRINESQDDHDFYAETNRIAREMDTTRQTGGTRYIQRSEMLEDVYTYNDFTHDGGKVVFRPQQESTGLDHLVPTLVTESNGHMYPTKIFDQEARTVEHAIRHLRVINEAMGRDDLVGGISWCAFDYNTHGCFGSGDKICYHGVYDMFRNPKFAAYSYASQKSPEEEVVLEPITVASRGERDGGGTVPFTVLTNCDFVRVHKNGKVVGDFYPDHKQFAHLPHPPITVSHLMEQDMEFGMSEEDTKQFRDFLAKKVEEGTLIKPTAEDFAYMSGLAAKYSLQLSELYGMAVRAAGGWGDEENDLLLEGFWQGECVIKRRIGENKYFDRLKVEADDTLLCAQGDSYDATRICVTAVDNMGNKMPFIHECVQVTVEGPARLLGPDSFALVGGSAAFWVATTGEKGTVKLHVKGTRGESLCTITVE